MLGTLFPDERSSLRGAVLLAGFSHARCRSQQPTLRRATSQRGEQGLMASSGLEYHRALRPDNLEPSVFHSRARFPIVPS
jgi:hypothetical protein